MLTLELSVLIDFCSEGAVADFPKGLVYTIVPHIVCVKKLKDISGNGRRGNIDINDGCSMDLTVISGPIK
jgi:hypothetical protein